MNNIKYEDYYKGCLKYTYLKEERNFQHNINKDFHLFMIWEGGLSNVEDVVKNLTEKFDILFRADIQWSKEKLSENISRFYKIEDKSLIAAHCKNKARGGEFHCIVVEDKNPKYNYRQNISGPIRLVNINNLAIKRGIRNKMEGNFLHSSSCPEEFYEQIHLLFDEEKIPEILCGKINYIQHLKQDLSGSQGWKSFHEYFSVINKCSNYLVQRNFEFLPDNFFGNDKDVDILCDDFNEFIIASNAKGIKNSERTVYYININQIEVQFDVRSTDGKYYDSVWIKEMLSSKELFNSIVFRPNNIDYFFSLFYHSTIQKPEIKSVYIKRFIDISNEIGFDFLDKKVFSSDEEKAKLISGFLKANNYKVSKPVDETVYLNRNVLKYIDSNLIQFRSKGIIELYRKFIPKNLRSLIPAPLKKFVKRIF